MKYLIVVFCCWFSVVIYGQNSLEWVESYDFDRQRIKDCLVLQNKAQDIVLFAETSKKELYVATLDNSGTIRSKQKFPWKNAKLNAVLAAEGFYVLVGYEKEGSKKYPALWSINNITNRLQKQDLELPLETGILQDIDQNTNEEIIATGQLGDSLYLLRMDKNLGKVRDTTIHSEKGISGGQALTINSYGQMFVTGFQNNNGRNSLQVWKFNDDLGLIASLDTLRPGTGEDILITEDNEVLVLGNYNVTPFKKNAQFLFLRSNLKRIIQPKEAEHPLLESEYNQSGNSMILLPHQSVLIVGETTKFGASMRDILISTIYNINDTIVIREPIELRRDDWATKVIRLKNKNYVISAISEQRVKLFYYKSSDNPCEQQLPPDRAVAFVPLSNRKTVIGTNNSSLEGMLLAKQPIAKSNVAVRNSFLGRKSWVSEDDDWDVFKCIPQPTLNGQYCYYLEKSLLLKYGPNLVDLNITTDQNPFNYSEELYCVPEKPNLHLLSIGINYENLEFTDEDANDFAAQFESQEQQGALYETIETTVLTTKDETRASEIESKIAELGKKDLKNKDVIILFISAHGIDEQGRFVIPDPFYKAGFESSRLDYQKQILDKLKLLPGKKIIFIDACESGKIANMKGPGNEKEDYEEEKAAVLSKQILRMHQQIPGITAIVSSDSTQSSWESPSLKNGVFTEALIDAFGDSSDEADTDNNSFLTIEEVVKFLKKRIPELTNEFSLPDQDPKISNYPEQLEKDFPFFYIKKS